MKQDIILNINNNPSFCPNDEFRKKVIDILCKYLFVQGSNVLEKVYQEMNNNINNDKANLLYPMNSGMLNPKINLQDISQNGKIYAGHDLPVWLGNPEEAKIRIMVVSQDPRRSDIEMRKIGLNGNTGGIALSSPFGLHSYKWRSHKTKGLVHYLFAEMIEEYETLSVYYTDVYKLGGVDAVSTSAGKSRVMKTSVLDRNRKNRTLYFYMLQEEIELFKPNIVLLLGGEAKNAFKSFNNANINKANNTINFSFPSIEVPHPTARPNTWKAKISSITTDEKKQFYKNEILAKLNHRS